jgi:acetyltransferase-like isoleucine patch superfamily enzyme
MVNLVLVGSGAVMAEVDSYLADINRDEKKYQVIGVVDDNYDNYVKNTKKYNISYPYLGTTETFQLIEGTSLVLTIGSIEARNQIKEKLNLINSVFCNIIHPTVQLAKSISLGFGNIIYPNCVIGPNTQIGNFNLFTSFTCVSHDTSIGNNNIFATFTGAGSITIKDNNYFGLRVSVIPEVLIGSNNVIQAGMVIDKNVSDNEVVFYRYKEKIQFIQSPRKL